MRLISSSFAALALLVASHAHAAGFEKSVMWSGRYAGTGGAAATGSVSGSQSVYFNPAGLVGQSDISLNYSPTYINVDGSLVNVNRVDQSRPGVLPFGGGFVNYSKDKFGVGFGAYVAGGEKGIFPSVDLTTGPNSSNAITYRPTLETDLMIMEYALGAAYQVAPGFRIGAAWRISTAKGTLSSIYESSNNLAYSHLLITDAKDTSYGGFRLGAMLDDQKNHKWSLGAEFRSSVKFNAAGTGSGATIVLPTTAVSPQTVTGTAVGVTLPAAFSLGGRFDVNRDWKVFADVDYTNYAVDDKIYFSGTANGIQIPNVQLNWSNMWNWRLGFEYDGFKDLALRAGYVRTSQVTSSTDSTPTIPPPGAGNTVTAGLGVAVAKACDIDVAGEYSKESGTGTPTPTLNAAGFKDLLQGQPGTVTTANVYAVHLGLTYKF